MSAKKSSDGSGFAGGLIFGVFVLIAMIPKQVWIGAGIAVALGLVIWIVYAIVNAVEKQRIETNKRIAAERLQQAADAKHEREEKARQAKERRIKALGSRNAARVESTQMKVKQITASEAAKAGWLGDVDFSADVKGIYDNFKKAYALRGVAGTLRALANPSADDRKILAEATATADDLERVAIEWVDLISRCAVEAQQIDESLRVEREDARIAEQRSELHAKLSGMLYGIEAAPEATPEDSAVEGVLARVQAYREIKSQIQQTRAGGCS